MSCRYHLALDVGRPRPSTKRPPRITLNLPEDPDLWPADAPTCALHLADEGPHTLDQLGGILGDISRERARQIGSEALARLAEYGIVQDMAEDLDLDLDTPPTRNLRPSANSKGHHASEWRPRSGDPELDGTYTGAFRSQDMTAKMRRIQEESRAACPARTVTLPSEEIARIEASIRAKQPAPRANATNARVTANTFTMQTHDPRSAARYARSRESLQSYRRLTAPDAPAKAPTTTQPRQPSPPSPSPIESPPVPTHAEATPEAPALVQSDDQPEVAVVSALPDPQPTPPSPPMTRPDPRTRRTAYADAHETAQRNLAKLMAERGLTRDKLSALARDAYTEHTAHSVDQGVVRALHGTASPVSVWYRRLASLLGVPLSDLCSDPMWLAAVAPEDSPIASPHSHLHRPPAPLDTPPILPQHSPESTLIPLLAEALRQAQAADRRTAELTALTGILRAEIDDLQQQLAACTKERDAATTTLARIKAAL